MKTTKVLFATALLTLVACGALPPEEGEGIASEIGEEPVATESEELRRHDDLGLLALCGDIGESCCGSPGDRGNALGVGKFCLTDKQCKRNKGATVCSSFENETEDHKSFFCTMQCDPEGAADQCGAGASCVCEESGLCGCTPDSCTENLPPHCEEA